MTRNVFKTMACALLMVMLCAGTAFAADGFTEAEKQKYLTDDAARSSVYDAIEIMPDEEFKQIKTEIESVSYYESENTGYIKFELNSLPGYEKYKDIQMQAGFTGYSLYVSTSKKGEYEYLTGFSHYPYYKGNVKYIAPCSYAVDVAEYHGAVQNKDQPLYFKAQFFRAVDGNFIYTEWSDIYATTWNCVKTGKKYVEDNRKNYVDFGTKAGTYPWVNLELKAEEGAKIYYTTDGSKPTTKSKRYKEPIYIGKTTTVKAIAVKKGVKSKVYTAKYTIKAATPFIYTEIVAKNGKLKYKVTLDLHEDTKTYYTTDGSKPTKKSKKYTKTFYIDVDKTLRLRTYEPGCISTTVTPDLPELPDLNWKPDGWKGEDYGSGERVEGNVQVAGQFCDVRDYTRKFYTPGMTTSDARRAMNSYVGYVYSRRFFDDGISINDFDKGTFAKFICGDNGELGVNVYGWRKTYTSDVVQNECINMVMESFYFFTKDKDVAYALWSVVDYLNIYGSKYTTNEKIESFGFEITGETDTSMDLTMNGVKIHWEWGDDISGSNFYFYA